MTFDVRSPLIAAIWDEKLILNQKFPQKLKFADVIPVYKKKELTIVKSYRLVGFSLTISKIFE